MRRTMMMVMLCAALTMPLVASADDQTIPPEAQWTSTPPARSPMNVNQLASILVDQGMITPQAATPLIQPQASSPSAHSHGRGWTWDEIDHSPVRSTGD